MKSLLFLSISLFLSSVALAETRVSFSRDITPSTLRNLEKDIVKAIKRMDPQDYPEVFIDLSSAGGDLNAAIRFVDRVSSLSSQHRVQIHTRVLYGSCDSACTVLFTAGSRRIARSNSSFGFHSPQIASRVPRGTNRGEILDRARVRWVDAISRVDSRLASELERGGFLQGENMRYFSGRDVYTGYVNELQR